MKKLLSTSLLILFFAALAYGIDINEVRGLYKKAAIDEKANETMLSILSSVDEKSPLLLGYKASGTMMMANYVINPLSKLSYFNRGKRMLESAIAADTKSLELRFLRFMVQVNSPSFLGYVNNIESDKRYILDNMVNMTDMKSKEFVSAILKDSKHLNPAEKTRLF
jgi:hypothetical protein